MAEASEIDTKHCEACDREIGPTEARYHAFDCDLCIRCAPTWREELDYLRGEIKELIREGDTGEVERLTERAEYIEGRIARGEVAPDDKSVSLPDITSEDMH